MVPLAESMLGIKFITDNLILSIGLVVVLLPLLFFLSSFFAQSEVAYSSVNLLRLRNYLEEDKKGAKKAIYIAERFDLTLTTIYFGNVLVNSSITIVLLYLLYHIIGKFSLAILITIVIATFLIILISEIFPKSYGRENVDKIVLRNAGFMFIIIKILYPITWVLTFLKKKLLRKQDDKQPTLAVTEEELENIIDEMENEGVIDEDNAELIQSAINLGDTTVYDIMTPRVDVVAIEVDDSIESIKETFFENQFSRIPVYEEHKDNIIGILSERDFFTALIKNPNNINIKDLVSKPYYVSPTAKVDDLIKDLQLIKKHFAIVSDEYGGTSGIVTMEDALEELVGEIYDEYDDENENNIKQLEENTYLVSTEMDLEELFEYLKLGDAPETKYASVGGFIYELSEGLPTEGKEIHIHSQFEEKADDETVIIDYDLTFTIRKVENRRIRQIELHIEKREE